MKIFTTSLHACTLVITLSFGQSMAQGIDASLDCAETLPSEIFSLDMMQTKIHSDLISSHIDTCSPGVFKAVFVVNNGLNLGQTIVFNITQPY